MWDLRMYSSRFTKTRTQRFAKTNETDANNQDGGLVVVESSSSAEPDGPDDSCMLNM
jgi:hypothetical protein